MSDPGSPRSRLEDARKQLGLAFQAVDDDVVEANVAAALADTENALEALEHEPEVDA